MIHFQELKRLQNEKRAHATALLAERKKLAQSNRELMDNRRELDEMFRKILKINRDSVETYLEDIARGGSLNLSEMEAEKCIVEMSDKLDLMENYLKNGSEEDERLPESSIFSEVTDKRELDHDKTSDDLVNFFHDDTRVFFFFLVIFVFMFRKILCKDWLIEFWFMPKCQMVIYFDLFYITLKNNPCVFFLVQNVKRRLLKF